jgi:hypothetical protein
MSLSNLASIGALVSGVGVLISLIYLALQVRQAERNQRAAVNQGLLSRYIDIYQTLIEPPLADLFFRGVSGRDDFTDDEVLQLTHLVSKLALHAMDAHLQRRSRLIDDLSFQAAIRPVRILFCYPAFRALWPMSRQTVPREFGEFFEREILSVPLREATPLADQFRANLTALSRPVAV